MNVCENSAGGLAPRQLIRALGLSTILAAITFPAGAASPLRGYSKFVIVPNASAPPTSGNLLTGVDAEILETYEEMIVGRIRQADVSTVRGRAKTSRQDFRIEDNYDRIHLPGGTVDARLGTADSLPRRALSGPYAPGKEGLYILQFIGPPRLGWYERLRNLGATMIQPVPLNSIIVAGDVDSIARVSSERFIQFVDRYHATLKPGRVDPRPNERDFIVRLAAVADASHDREAVNLAARATPTTLLSGPEEIRLQVRLLPDGARSLLELPLVLGVHELPSFRLSDERVAMSLTRHVDGNGSPTSPTLYKRWLQDVCPYCGNLAAEGFKVGIADASGINGGSDGPHHADLPGSRLTFGTNFADLNDTELQDPGGHATMVAGIIAGDPAPTAGAGMGGFLYGQGVAPSAGLVATVIRMNPNTPNLQPSTFTNVGQSAADARMHGARIQNHSYNRYTLQDCFFNDSGLHCPTYLDGEYDITAGDFDRVIRDDQMTLVVSSGNIDQQGATIFGTPNDCIQSGVCLVPNPRLTLPPATAKNVISVGGTENVRDAVEQWGCHGSGAASYSNVMSNSKRGTRIPGYIKPDLMAPAGNITSLKSVAYVTPAATDQSPGFCNFAGPNKDIELASPGYFASSGTSWAAPVVAGAAVLASRRYAETVRGSGAADPAAAKPSLIKAMLIAGAKSMRGGIDQTTGEVIGPIPNERQGFGRVHLEEVLSRYPARVYVNEQITLPSSSVSTAAAFRVHDPTLPVKVVIVWSDLPYDDLEDYDGVSTVLLNDLDLTVELGPLGQTPCPQTYLGNKLTVLDQSRGEESLLGDCTGAGFDRTNNVEYIKFHPVAQNLSITDFAVRVRFHSGISQAYSLVVYNAYYVSEPPASTAPPPGPVPAPPAYVVATAAATGSSWSATLSWPASANATGYEVFASTSNGPFVSVGSSVTTTISHVGLVAGFSYIYKVRASNVHGVSDFSPADIATTIDLPVAIVGQPVEAAHWTNLRQAVNAARLAAGLQQTSFSNSPVIPGVTVIRAAHVHELRTALHGARAALWLPLLSPTDPTLAGTVSTIRAIHLNDLRQGVE